MDDSQDERPYKYYDMGWNARLEDSPLKSAVVATKSWRDGWKDCNELSEEERQRIGRI